MSEQKITHKSLCLNVWLPFSISLLALIWSIAKDLEDTSSNWIQRSGNIMIVAGAYIGYFETKQSTQRLNNEIYINPDLWFKYLALFCVVLGTVLSGYGDLLFRKLL